jgi:hypothetical protein
LIVFFLSFHTASIKQSQSYIVESDLSSCLSTANHLPLNQRTSSHTPFTSRIQPETASSPSIAYRTTTEHRINKSYTAAERLRHRPTMSSSSSYGSYTQDKGTYTSRPSTSSTSTLPFPTIPTQDDSNILQPTPPHHLANTPHPATRRGAKNTANRLSSTTVAVRSTTRTHLLRRRMEDTTTKMASRSSRKERLHRAEEGRDGYNGVR